MRRVLPVLSGHRKAEREPDSGAMELPCQCIAAWSIRQAGAAPGVRTVVPGLGLCWRWYYNGMTYTFSSPHIFQGAS